MSGGDQSVINAWLTLRIEHDVARDTELDLKMMQYFEDGFAYESKPASVTVDASRTSMEVEIPFVVYLKAGQHGIYVSNEGRKVAQVEFDITQ